MMLPGMSSPLRLLDCLEGVLYVSLAFENGFVSFFSVKLGVEGRLMSTGLLPALASAPPMVAAVPPPPPKEAAMEDEGRKGVLGRDDGIEAKLGLKREMKSGRLTVENPEGWKGADRGVLGGRLERLSRSFSCFKAMSCLCLTHLASLRFVFLFLIL